jgi:2-polyprenyl-6-methoxyphenol hydroxylase-like FAD-dependent oxidoreductase
MTLEHAVVIGASFAGVGAARVLSERCAHVTIVERDEIPAEWGPRKGVPQSPHVHGIPKLGRELMQELFPGFVEETQSLGAVLFDQVKTGAAWGRYGWSARGESAAIGYGVRRALLEHVARQRVLALPNVAIETARVDGYSISSGRITGVLLEGGGRLDADLVVDTGGKGSTGPKWLEDAGLPVPEESQVNGFVGYSSRWLHVPEDAWPGDYRYIGQLPLPSCTKGGILYPQDNGLYVMSLFGHARDYPPSDDEGFLAFLEHCATPLMHHVVARSEPASPIVTSRSTANRRRHYERIPDPPAGLVTFGDALGAFNPIFGQGISAGLQGSMILADSFDDVEGDVEKLPRTFQPRIAAWLDIPWGQATGFDLAFPTTTGTRTDPTPEQQAMAEYVNVLAQLSTVDHKVAEAVLVANQSFDPGLLRKDELRAKADQWVAEGRTPPPSDPTRPPEVVS